MLVTKFTTSRAHNNIVFKTKTNQKCKIRLEVEAFIVLVSTFLNRYYLNYFNVVFVSQTEQNQCEKRQKVKRKADKINKSDDIKQTDKNYSKKETTYSQNQLCLNWIFKHA